MTLDLPEPPQPPAKGSSLPRWLEWTTAIAALVISVCSIGIALYNVSIESRMLKANSYAYLVLGASEGRLDGPAGPLSLSIELLNNGVGPADERSLKIKLGDRYVTDVKDLIHMALGSADSDEAQKLLDPVYDNKPTRFIASKDHGLVFRIDRTPQNARYWDQLHQAIDTQGLDLEACYCSVFDECWVVGGRVRERVKACVRDDAHEFMPVRRTAGPPLPRR